MEFERASMHYIQNFTTAPSNQSKCIRIKEIELADCNCSLLYVYIEKQYGSNSIIQDKRDKSKLVFTR